MFDVDLTVVLPSLWEGLGEGAKLSGVQALSLTLSQKREGENDLLCV